MSDLRFSHLISGIVMLFITSRLCFYQVYFINALLPEKIQVQNLGSEVGFMSCLGMGMGCLVTIQFYLV